MDTSADPAPSLGAGSAAQGTDQGLTLVFGVGDLLCALPLEDVVETLRPLPVQPLAGTAGTLLGMSVIRGRAVPVVDTARLLGVAGGAPARFISTRTGRGPLAYAAGPVVGVRPFVADGQEPRATRLVAAVGVLDSRPLLLLRGGWLLDEPVRGGHAA